MRALLLGDTHGSAEAILYAYGRAKEFDCAVVFQLGDCGFWEHSPHGVAFVDFIAECAFEYGLPFYWLDGNHENHVLLRQKYSDKVTDDGFWYLRDGLYYSPRGHRFEWDGVKFMTMGGAYSVDKNWRKPGISWWPEETITDEEVDAAGDAKIDVLLSHDLPRGVDMVQIMARRGFKYTHIPASEHNRDQLRKVVERTRPSRVYHGHYHTRHDQTIYVGTRPIRVTGLANEDTGTNSWTILDTEEF